MGKAETADATDTAGILSIHRLLAAVPAAEAEQLQPLLTRMHVAHHQPLYAMDAPITAVWFPIDALVSLVMQTDERVSVEVAAVGHEGVAGLPVFLGQTSDARLAQEQVAGTVLAMEAAVFSQVSDQLPGLHAVLQRYTQVLFIQMGQGVACNARHSLSERGARWLLGSPRPGGAGLVPAYAGLSRHDAGRAPGHSRHRRRGLAARWPDPVSPRLGHPLRRCPLGSGCV